MVSILDISLCTFTWLVGRFVSGVWTGIVWFQLLSESDRSTLDVKRVPFHFLRAGRSGWGRRDKLFGVLPDDEEEREGRRLEEKGEESERR